MNKQWTNQAIFEAIMADAREQVERGHKLDMSTYGIGCWIVDEVITLKSSQCPMCFASATLVSRKVKNDGSTPAPYMFARFFGKRNDWGAGFQDGIMFFLDDDMNSYDDDKLEGYRMGKRCVLAARKEGILHVHQANE